MKLRLPCSISKVIFTGIFLLAMTSLRADAAVIIVALGDSTTAGAPDFRSPAEIPPKGSGNPESQYAYWVMKRHPEWQVINRGISGERSDQILRRFESDVLAYHPEIVIVLAGVNDLYQGHSVESIENNLKAIYEKAKQNNIKILTCTVLPYNFSSEEIKGRMKQLNDWILKTAQAEKFGFCDTYKALENPKSPGALLSSRDGLHPDKESYQKMGEAIGVALESMSSSAAKNL